VKEKKVINNFKILKVYSATNIELYLEDRAKQRVDAV